MSFSFTAIILSAGFGKRMMPLTKNIPKPLVNVNGTTLIENSIIFLRKLGCKKIIINTHYLHHKVESYLNEKKEKDDIYVVYEKEILETGGAIKNVIPLFNNDNILIINSDVFWIDKNIPDAQLLINSYNIHKESNLLLVRKKNAYGLEKSNGDFIIKNNKIIRYSKKDEIIFFSGLQILNTNILKNFSKKKFSVNFVWDILINQGKLFGEVMESDWYHVGDIKGLNLVKKLNS